jgi:branched-chain amino acid transport system ATP-binding protein
MLRVTDLVVRYGRTTALHGISFTVNRGEVVALVGPNGAGKTTTLKAIVGLVPVAKGAIELDGKALLKAKPELLLRRGISLVPEGRHIFASLTVLENLALGAAVRHDRMAARHDITGFLERFPALGRRRKSAAGKLSGGEQQQLAIARALISKPELLLLDEPSLGLAPLIVDQIFEVVNDLRTAGTTVLLVEQNASRAIELADRSYVLRTGEIVLAGDSQTVLGSEDFISSYLGFAAVPAIPVAAPVTLAGGGGS